MRQAYPLAMGAGEVISLSEFQGIKIPPRLKKHRGKPIKI